MKNPKIVLVAEWDGWCGACADDRPLVLTRTGRQRLRTWLTGAADRSRPLMLTCRLCGTGVDVPPEQDDPPVVVAAQELEWPAAETAPGTEATLEAAVPAAVPVPPSAPELAVGRQAVAQALGALLAQRTTMTTVTAPLVQPAPVLMATPPVTLPLQRIGSSDGLAELQLLADGIDVLSSGRT